MDSDRPAGAAWAALRLLADGVPNDQTPWICERSIATGNAAAASAASTTRLTAKTRARAGFGPETGRFFKKTGRRLSMNGQSLGGIRDLNDFFKNK